MSAAVTGRRISSEQLNILLSFMEEHRDFAAGKQSIYSRYSASKLWRLLAERLNAAAVDSGGVRKSPDKWCRYWADIKYKARKKAAANGSMGETSTVEERVQNILDTKPKSCCGGCTQVEEEGKSSTLEDDMVSEAEGGDAGNARLSTEEVLAEAAMRSALAAERQAETVVRGVTLLRELTDLLRAALPPPAPPPAALDPTLALHHHHHRM
ncbi:uncharacterized protein LOC121739155 [Aricia agestis]|uniref:uncharacterized protein LOC121739155 n=1 Tax=Aricia agestis TaxID=91739 RepID=UPI001C203828|nr:uncharacterized protein LOC121739155 [Aricia agestis]